MKELEEGSATLAVLGAILVVTLLAALGIYLGAIHSQKVRVQAVADLSALAGAQISPSALLAPGTGADVPCSTASRVAQENGAEVPLCEEVGGDLRVVVRIRVAPFSPLGLPGVSVEARARAGPDDAFR